LFTPLAFSRSRNSRMLWHLHLRVLLTAVRFLTLNTISLARDLDKDIWLALYRLPN
jgi:hypothetical protein